MLFLYQTGTRQTNYFVIKVFYMQYTIPKGVFDILPLDPDKENSWRNSNRWQYIEETIRNICSAFGYKEIRTPIFERTELFIRGVGEGSDIVSKEMYTFLDKGDRSMTLRPEGTASIMRAFVEKKLYTQSTLHKYFYIGPMFRYERPQAGRYRQHHQFGAEAIGIEKPQQDAEVIDMISTLYSELGLKNLKVMINSVGGKETRSKFMNSLKEFLMPNFENLSEDSKNRFHKNILRILDSKDPVDKQLLQSAPSILDFLSDAERVHFDTLCSLLNKLCINFQIEPNLVRGLDYYSKTVFEITTTDLGAQNSLGGGGRYDGLIETLGGPNLPSVGFGTGLERVLQTMDRQNTFFPEPKNPLVFFIPLGTAAKEFCFDLVSKLRHEKIYCEIDLSEKKIQHGLQLANHLNASHAIIIGDDEITTGQIQIKNLKTRETSNVIVDELTAKIRELHILGSA